MVSKYASPPAYFSPSRANLSRRVVSWGHEARMNPGELVTPRLGSVHLYSDVDRMHYVGPFEQGQLGVVLDAAFGIHSDVYYYRVLTSSGVTGWARAATVASTDETW